MVAVGIRDMHTHCQVLFKPFFLLTQSIPKVPFPEDKGIIPILMVQ